MTQVRSQLPGRDGSGPGHEAEPASDLRCTALGGLTCPAPCAEIALKCTDLSEIPLPCADSALQRMEAGSRRHACTEAGSRRAWTCDDGGHLLQKEMPAVVVRPGFPEAVSPGESRKGSQAREARPEPCAAAESGAVARCAEASSSGTRVSASPGWSEAATACCEEVVSSTNGSPPLRGRRRARGQDALALGDDRGHDRLTCHVGGGAAHVDDRLDRQQQTHSGQRKAQGG